MLASGDGSVSGAAWNSARLRAMPEDFREVAPSLGIRQAKARWVAGQPTIMRWCAEAGIKLEKKAAGTLPSIPPKDFREVVGLTKKEACQRWNVGMTTLQRWLKDTGFR